MVIIAGSVDSMRNVFDCFFFFFQIFLTDVFSG